MNNEEMIERLEELLHDFKSHGLSIEMTVDNIIQDIIIIKCKETAKNVRHKAVEIADGEYISPIMNIHFKDIKPEGL